jgi:hypothetical protein
MRRTSGILIFILLLNVWANNSFSQTNFFQFKVQKEGVYKITTSQLSRLGIPNLNQVSIYGYPGILPQKLDSTQLNLQEIPALEKNGALYFFLTGPNILQTNENGPPEYIHHGFVDSLSFLIGTSASPLRIPELAALEATADFDSPWYSWTTWKEEKNNILNSGRVWFSDPIRNGQSLNINLGLGSPSDFQWKLYGNLMGQSSSSSTLRLLTGNTLISEINFTPIPNSLYGIKGREVELDVEFSPPQKSLAQIRFTFQGAGDAAGYLDYFMVGVPFRGDQLSSGVFYSSSKSPIRIPPGLIAFEVNDFYNPVQWTISSGSLAYGKKWALFSETAAQEISDLKPVDLSLRIPSSFPTLLIITHPTLLSSAQRLASHKNSIGTTTQVVTTDQIFQSFGYGNKDITAIRNYIAWQFHTGKTLKNVLIFGKGTFDSKSKLGGRPNLVITYSSRNSLNPLTTFSSDDYLGLIDWGQGEWEESRDGDELMKIGIGRIPVINSAEANRVVNKIISYETQLKPGIWKRNVTFLADDADNNIHLRDSEIHAAYLEKNHTDLFLEKLYLDRFEQLKENNVQSSPDAKKALEKTLNEGTLILNFVGHGNETTLTAEEVFRVSDLANWGKQENLALWVTATCEFGRQDSPFLRSAAEELLIAENKGAIGLLTTGRPVFSSVNFSLNEAFIEQVFRKENHLFQDLGSIFKNTKNNSLNGALNRNFSLIGDPSLKLAIPELEVKINEITDASSKETIDTLNSLRPMILNAEIIDPITGSTQIGFTGRYQIEIRDQKNTVKTLGDESSTVEFKEESILLFKGTGVVKEGILSSEFILPKSIKELIASGSLRIYAWDENSNFEAMGNSIPVIGGLFDEAFPDTEGPLISVTFGDQDSEESVFQSSTIELTASFEDISGIFISNSDPTRLLSIQVNDNSPQFVGDLYLALGDSFQKGNVKTRISGLVEGKNKIIIRASDNLGNGSILEKEIEVSGTDQIRILSHKTYPNPASTVSHFEIAHNRPGENLILTFSVYSPSGQILLSESQRLVNAEEILKDLSWIFLQSQTKYPAKGTYIYRLALQSEEDYTFTSVSGQIVIQ